MSEPEVVTQNGEAVTQKRIQDEEWGLVGLPTQGALTALKSFCKQLVGTPFLPRSLGQNLSADQQAVTLFATVLTGREMGLTPMQSLRAFWLSPDGRLGMYADAMLALCLTAGAAFDWIRLDDDGAELLATRKDGNKYRARFNSEDAKRAGLLQKNNSLYLKYPRAMYRSRVIGEVFRSLYPDLGGGQMYTKEEIVDMEPEAETSYRAIAEAEGDQKAAEDPKYEIRRKTIETVAAAGLHKNHGQDNFSDFRNANGLNRSEARNEQFLKDQAGAPFEKADEVPAPSQAATMMEDVAARIRSMSENLQIPITPLSEFVVGYLGDTQVGPENVSKVLNDLTRIWEDHPKEVLAELVENGGRMGEEVRLAHNQHLPWVPKKQKTTKPKGVQQSL